MALHWPFRSPLDLPPDEADRWWAQCFVSVPWPSLRAAWVAVVGPSGSGKSVALAARVWEESDTFYIHYPLDHWPNGPKAWMPMRSHLPQVMAEAGWTLLNYFRKNPAQLQNLNTLHKEYLRWLLEKHHSERAYRRFALDVGDESLLQIPFTDLYPTYTAQADVAGQVDELVSLVQALGFQRVRLIGDFNEREIALYLDEARWERFVEELLLGVEHPHFGGYVALPPDFAFRALSRSRGRLQLLPLQWTQERIWKMIQKMWAAADCPVDQAIFRFPLWAQFEQHLRQRGVHEPWVPRFWVAFAETVCVLMERETSPLAQLSFPEALVAFYARHVPLRVHRKSERVWLGDWPLELTPQLRTLLMVMVEQRGRPLEPVNEHLLARLGLGAVSEESARQTVHTLISRLRKRIEPWPAKPVYVHNRRGMGYWLEHVVEV